jgi:predicted nucleic acid-binding protein
VSAAASTRSASAPRTTSATAWDNGLTEILVDAGPLIAGFDDTDVWHDECSRLLETLAGPLIVPATIVAEVCYMITRYRFGPAAEAAFLRSFARGELVVGNLVDEDFERMAQLVEQCDNFPLGGSDASVIAIAERRSITTILTTDRRHFAAVRPRHVDAFELLP